MAAAPGQPSDLSDFLAALHAAGIPVGPGEVERLRYLFACRPALDRDGLHAMLAALLIKNEEHRARFDALFSDWCPDSDAEWPFAAERRRAPRKIDGIIRPAPPEIVELPPEPTPPPWWRGLIKPGLLIAPIAVFLIWAAWPPAPIISPADTTQAEKPTPPPPAATPPDLPAEPAAQVWYWHAAIDRDSLQPPPPLGPARLALLGLLSALLAFAMWWRYRKRYPVIKPDPPERYLGHGWQPLPPLGASKTRLVGGREQRQLSWNIERFVTEDPTRRLDIPRTVDATARTGGFADLCFKPAVYEREVWFWVDRQLRHAAPWTVVAQLLATLTRTGLSAHRGLFTEAPGRVDWPNQNDYRPQAEEGQGRQALVAILTDGQGLSRRLENEYTRQPTQRLLAALRRWPRLCFVDCSAEPGSLRTRLAPFDLEVITLEHLPTWLGGSAHSAPRADPLGDGLYGDERAWAGALALGGLEADEQSARALRQALKLRVNPYREDRVLHEVRQRPMALINWLLRCEPLDRQRRLLKDGLARRALDWWRLRYRNGSEAMRARQSDLLPWDDSLASRRWRVEDALLQLHTEPNAAAEHLTRLADETLGAEIRARLTGYAAVAAPQEPIDDRFIYPTWTLGDLPALTRHRLRALGFAAGRYRREPPPLADYAKPLVVSASVLAGLAIAAFAVALQQWLTSDEPELIVEDRDIAAAIEVAPTVRLVERVGDDRYRVTVGSARQIDTEDVAPGTEVRVRWRWGGEGFAGFDNVIELPDSETVLLHAGRLAQPIRPCIDGWPRRSIAVIASAYDDAPARQLAIRLLDKGSADQVLLGADWPAPLAAGLGASVVLNKGTQVLIILPASADSAEAERALAKHPGPWAVVTSTDFSMLARALDFQQPLGRAQKSVKPLAELPELRVIRQQGEVLVAGATQRVRDPDSGITWVRICPGTFGMGSAPGEDMANNNEIPSSPRIVTLSEFEMAAIETTVAPDTRPVDSIKWSDARDYCKQLPVQGDSPADLPTEAQWEYAARGGSRTPWSFGDDQDQLENFGWYETNSKDGSKPVAQLNPNPLGLYDMHGNLWEWVRDWYAAYSPGFEVDPSSFESSDQRYRVLRGGSFHVSPAVLRSADRFFDSPVYRDRSRDSGFRCVRVPPQP